MRPLAFLILLLLAGWAGAAFPQALPYYVDPSARDAAPDLSAVPSIRFLTTADFPPFNYRDKSGALVGFNIDLARSICSELKLACTIQAWPWAQAPKALADNQGDALIAGLALSAANGEQFDFSDIYLGLPGRFVTKADAIRGFDPARLAGKTVAVRRGTTHEQFVERYLPKVKIAEFNSETDALAAVAAGQADAYFGDGLRASFWLNDNAGCRQASPAPRISVRTCSEMVSPSPCRPGTTQSAMPSMRHSSASSATAPWTSCICAGFPWGSTEPRAHACR